MQNIQKAVQLIKQAKKITVVCGAGISVACGIPDFRSEGTGLYSQLQAFHLPYPTAMFELSAFYRRPRPFYHLSGKIFPDSQFTPSLAHFFFVYLQENHKLNFVVTQNIDDLELISGLPQSIVSQAHGTFMKPIVCGNCGLKMNDYIQQKRAARDNVVLYCENCGCAMKPQITFFGEPLPPECALYNQKVRNGDLLLILGTSLKVAPVNSIPTVAKQLKIPRVLINREVVGELEAPEPTDCVVLGEIDQQIEQICGSLGVDIVKYREQKMRQMAQVQNLDVNFVNQDRLELVGLKNSLIVPDAYLSEVEGELTMFALIRADQSAFLKSRKDVKFTDVFVQASCLPPQMLGEMHIQSNQKLKIAFFDRIIKNELQQVVYAPLNCHYNSYLTKYLAYVSKRDADVWDLLSRYVGSKTEDELVESERRQTTLKQPLYSQLPIDSIQLLMQNNPKIKPDQFDILWKNLLSNPQFEVGISIPQGSVLKMQIVADSDDLQLIQEIYTNKKIQINEFVFDLLKTTPNKMEMAVHDNKLLLVLEFMNLKQGLDEAFSLIKPGILNTFKKYATGVRKV